MIIAIIRFFGWGKVQPIRSTLKVRPGQPPRVSQTALTGVTVPPEVPAIPATAHDKSAAAAAAKGVEPAMAVIPRDVVQMPPRAASPGLPPVDPEEKSTAPHIPAEANPPPPSAVKRSGRGKPASARKTKG